MSKVIEVIKSFKYSVNIKDDFLDAQKLNGFFATQKNSEFIFRTLETIRNGNNKAILLSGAYGTGKSFLVSIIAAFLSGKLKIDSDLQELKSKLVSHDDSYQKILNQVRNKKYLIVFPDDSFASFSQAICLGITEVIHSENLPIVLNSTFDGIIQRISRWENEHPVFYTALLEALKEKRWTISKLLKKLKLFDPVAYRIFEEIYPLILGGEKFVPLGNANNITAVMRDFEQAVKAVGYDGVLYIFDEFGRFLENNIESLDVKQIQDAAEYCNSGTDSSLVLISHKDIFQYLTVTKDYLLLVVPKNTNWRFPVYKCEISPYQYVELSDFQDIPFITQLPSETIYYLEQKAFRRWNLTPSNLLSEGSLETAHQMTQHHMGCSFTMRRYLSHDISPDLNYYLIGDPPISAPISLVFRQCDFIPPYIHELARFLKTIIQ